MIEVPESDRRRRIWGRRVIAGVTLLLLAAGLVVGACAYESYNYHITVGYQMPCLAGAIHLYYQNERALPHTLDGMTLYGRGAYRLPANGWEGWNQHSGPKVLYLPVRDWDGNTPYVIAVQPPLGRCGSLRHYLVLGDTAPRQAMEGELGEVLSRDDELRARNHQPGRWDRIDWRSH